MGLLSTRHVIVMEKLAHKTVILWLVVLTLIGVAANKKEQRVRSAKEVDAPNFSIEQYLEDWARRQAEIDQKKSKQEKETRYDVSGQATGQHDPEPQDAYITQRNRKSSEAPPGHLKENHAPHGRDENVKEGQNTTGQSAPHGHGHCARHGQGHGKRNTSGQASSLRDMTRNKAHNCSKDHHQATPATSISEQRVRSAKEVDAPNFSTEQFLEDWSRRQAEIDQKKSKQDKETRSDVSGQANSQHDPEPQDVDITQRNRKASEVPPRHLKPNGQPSQSRHDTQGIAEIFEHRYNQLLMLGNQPRVNN